MLTLTGCFALTAGPAFAGSPTLGAHFAARIDPGIPSELALRFARAAVGAGLTQAEAARILNDQRFRTAIGSTDQGYGMLQAITEHPDAIVRALELVRRHDLTAAGADSLQNAIMSLDLEIRNGYLEDLGEMAVVRGDGALVLVDLETGRQVIGQGKLGVPLRAPGGGPLPSPAPPPAVPPSPVSTPSDVPQPPGGVNVTVSQSDWSHLMPGIVVVGTLFVIAWAGYGLIAIGRWFRSHSRNAAQ